MVSSWRFGVCCLSFDIFESISTTKNKGQNSQRPMNGIATPKEIDTEATTIYQDFPNIHIFL